MTDKFKIVNSLIDAAGFWGGNYLLHSTGAIPPPHMRHVVLFAVADILVRNGWLGLSYVESVIPNGYIGKAIRQDAYISLLYLLLSAAMDGIIEQSNIGKAVINNSIRAAVGFGVNFGIDMAIPSDFK
jgi:hypothetical protein